MITRIGRVRGLPGGGRRQTPASG